MIILQADRRGPGPRPGRPWPETLLLLAAGAAMALALAFPLWRITLEAPQYPEGLGMFIHPRTISGLNPHDLNTINELNHYIGMKKIVPDAIPELRLISPLIAVFSLLAFAAAWRPRAWSSGLLLACLAAAGALGMYDFWRWEYDYGHDLDPMAAIKVPGMSYQPPLIGEARLLNFVSTSWPAAGGLLLFAAGAMIGAAFLLSVLRARGWRGLPFRARALSAAACLSLLACRGEGPAPFHWGEDACHSCKMILVEKGFAAQRVNAKGKAYSFDAIECLLEDIRSRPLGEGERIYVSDRSRPEAPPLPAASARFLEGGTIASPMGSALAAFASADSASAFRARVGGSPVEWERLLLR